MCKMVYKKIIKCGRKINVQTAALFTKYLRGTRPFLASARSEACFTFVDICSPVYAGSQIDPARVHICNDICTFRLR